MRVYACVAGGLTVLFFLQYGQICITNDWCAVLLVSMSVFLCNMLKSDRARSNEIFVCLVSLS